MQFQPDDACHVTLNRPENAAARSAPMFLLLAFALAATLLSGCAGTARGKNDSVYRAPVTAAPRDEAAPAAPIAAPDAAALVVIRYPAMIHADAESLYVSSFAVNAIGGEVPYTMYGKPQTERIAQTVIAKSGYFAMSLYRELKARLPANTVLLSPHLVLWDEEQGLYSRPILASEQVPAVLTIDFGTYTFPDVNEMMDSPPVTFGDLVTPLAVVRTGRWARPALNGLVLSSDDLAQAAWRASETQAARVVEARLDEAPLPSPSSLDFIAFLAERDPPPASLPLTAPGTSGDRIMVEAYPLEKLQIPAGIMTQLDDAGEVDPFGQAFAGGFADRVTRLLGGVDTERATFFQRQAALARFDPGLARVWFTRSDDESVRARLQLAEALVGAEREFLAAQSDSIYAGTYTGDFGVRMRKIIAAEYRMLEERRRLARRQNITTAVAALALAGSVYGATVSTTASAAMVASLSGVSLLGSVWAMNKSLDTRSESAEVSERFIARMAPTFERQMSVQMEWLESREVITARGFAEFRNKTLTLYQSRVRSMAVSADAYCSFRHPEAPQPGRWWGECVDGEAAGKGFGVAATPGGSVEYLGDTRSGRAEGVGALLVRQRGRTPVYYEGEFRGGRADGTVWVETAGETPQLRQFRDGVDAGRAEAAERVAFDYGTGARAVAGLQ